MNRLEKDSNIVINKKNYLMSDLTVKLANLPSNKVSNFFRTIGLTVPKKLKMAVLKSVLKESVEKTIEERANLADELGYRLSWFSRYSEYQLENLLRFYNSVSLNRRYLETLWLELFNYMMEKKVSDKDLHQLILLSNNYKNLSDEDILEYNLTLKSIFYDEPSEIDGLTPDEFRPVLYKSSTLVELRELGRKYDVDVPKRLRKEQLADIIIDELKEKEKVSEDREIEIRRMSIVLMQRFAKDKDIKASIELKKEEVIEFILSNASQTKETYFLPSDSTIYMQELEPIVEEAAEAPVVEEIVEEKSVVEEVVKEVVEEVFEDDYTDVLAEIQYLRGLLREHAAECCKHHEHGSRHEVAASGGMKQPLVVNTAGFYSDAKHAKIDYQDFKASVPKALKADRRDAGESKTKETFVAVSWSLAIILLSVVIFLLIYYISGGIL